MALTLTRGCFNTPTVTIHSPEKEKFISAKKSETSQKPSKNVFYVQIVKK